MNHGEGEHLLDWMGRCPRCQYDIRGLGGAGVCPECGDDISIEARRRAQERFSWRRVHVPSVLTCIASPFAGLVVLLIYIDASGTGMSMGAFLAGCVPPTAALQWVVWRKRAGEERRFRLRDLVLCFGAGATVELIAFFIYILAVQPGC